MYKCNLNQFFDYERGVFIVKLLSVTGSLSFHQKQAFNFAFRLCNLILKFSS